jgi:hypothetical protein
MIDAPALILRHVPVCRALLLEGTSEKKLGQITGTNSRTKDKDKSKEEDANADLSSVEKQFLGKDKEASPHFLQCSIILESILCKQGRDRSKRTGGVFFCLFLLSKQQLRRRVARRRTQARTTPHCASSKKNDSSDVLDYTKM